MSFIRGITRLRLTSGTIYWDRDKDKIKLTKPLDNPKGSSYTRVRVIFDLLSITIKIYLALSNLLRLPVSTPKVVVLGD